MVGLFQAQIGRQNIGVLRCFKPYGKDHHIKRFPGMFSRIGDISQRHALVVFSNHRRMRHDALEPDSLVSGAFVKALEFFTVAADIHIKNRQVRYAFGQVLRRDRGLFDGIHAANGRTVPIVATVDVSGANTLYPGDFSGFRIVRGTDEMAHAGSVGGKESFIFETRHQIGNLIDTENLQSIRIKRRKPGR